MLPWLHVQRTSSEISVGFIGEINGTSSKQTAQDSTITITIHVGYSR